MYSGIYGFSYYVARLALSVEHETLNLKAVSSSLTRGSCFVAKTKLDLAFFTSFTK